MSDQPNDQPNLEMLFFLFGPDLGDDYSKVKEERPLPPTSPAYQAPTEAPTEDEARVADFDAEVAAAEADVPALMAGAEFRPMPWMYGQHNIGSFASRVGGFYGIPTRTMRDAALCTRENASRGDSFWQALQEVRAASPDGAYRIVMARLAAELKGLAGPDHGPFGNDWGE